MANAPTTPPVQSQRDSAIDLALATIEKQFGKGSIMRLSKDGKLPAGDVSVIPTGSLPLDIALGIGGLPRGRIVEIYGPESSGKTTLTLHAMPGPTTILLLPRRGTQARSYSARPCFIFHFANAFEDGPHVIIDADRLDRLPSVPVATKPRPGQSGSDYPRTILTRFILDTRSGQIEERVLTEHTGELPTINPAHWTRPHRYTWSLGTPLDQPSPYATGLLKVDAETCSSVFRDLRPNLAGEPIFVARPNSAAEDDGWILSMCYDARGHTGELLVLDAADLRTVCRLRMPHHSPIGFHGTWVAGLSA